MAPINSLSGLRKRYENDPARLAAIDAGEREGIAEANAELRKGYLDARRGYSPRAAARAVDAQAQSELDAGFRARTANMGRNPSLEMAARKAAVGTYGAGTHAVSVNGSTDLGSTTGAEAAAYAAANPGLRRGSDVFGRNDRAAAMQRNRDFIASGRGSMFGPRPATTKGQNAEALRGLKRYEAETARLTNDAAAQNHRHEVDQLAGLRRRELDITEKNNAAMARNDQLKMAQNAAAKYHSDLAKVLAGANLAPEVQASILEKMGGAAGVQPGGLGESGLGENRPFTPTRGQPVNRGMEQQPAPPSYKYQERPRGGLGNKDVKGYLEERGIVPQAWWDEEQKPPQPNPQEASPAGEGGEAATENLYPMPAPLPPEEGASQAPQQETGLKTGSRLRAAKQKPLQDQYAQGIKNLIQRGENPDDYIPVMGDFGGIQFVQRGSDLSSRNTYRKLTDEELGGLGLDASIYPAVRKTADMTMADNRYYGYH